jgi:arabinogalactan oligomer / maltooligosaccharide transport system substrate-binding protein
MPKAPPTMIGGWVESGLLNPDVDYDVMINTFGAGDAAFAITGPWAVAEADRGFSATGVPYEISPLPPVAGGTPQPFVGVQGFMVSAFAENPLLATTFLLDHMATEEAQLALFEAGRRPPALLSAFDQVDDDADIAGFGESGQNGVPMPAIPEMASVWTAWEDAYLLIYEQQGDPQENFTNAAEQIRGLIGQ